MEKNNILFELWLYNFFLIKIYFIMKLKKQIIKNNNNKKYISIITLIIKTVSKK